MIRPVIRVPPPVPDNPRHSDAGKETKVRNGSLLSQVGSSGIALQRMKTQLQSSKDLGYHHSIVHSHAFQSFFTSLTLFNALQMGAEAERPDWTRAWLICEHFFTAGFAMELVTKLWFLKKHYFSDRANWLDAFLTVLGITDCWILPLMSDMVVDLQSLSVLRVLRLIRLARILRLVRGCRQLVLAIRGITKALSSASFVFVFSICVIYVFAIFCTEYLGRSSTDLYPGFSTDQEVIDQLEFMREYNPYVYFGSMISSMFTLFNMSLGQEWRDISRAIAMKQPFFLPILGFFVLFVGLVVLNVLIAVIVDTVISESRQIEKLYYEEVQSKKLETLAEIEGVLSMIDRNGDGMLNAEEMETALETSDLLKSLVESIHLPMGWAPSELLDMLDSKGMGELHYSEFTAGFFRLLDSDDFQQICIMESSINQVKQMLTKQSQRHEAMYLSMQADIASIKAALVNPAKVKDQAGDQQILLQSTAEMHRHSENAFSAPCHKPMEQQSHLACNEEITHSSPSPPHLPMADDLMTRLRLEESLREALLCVKKCINEEFAAKPSLDSERREVEWTCSDAEISSRMPLRAPMVFPVGKPRRQPPTTAGDSSKVSMTSKGVVSGIRDPELQSGVHGSVLTGCSPETYFCARS